MKSLVVAFVCFMLLVWGLYDVKSFKTTLKKGRKTAAPKAQTGPIMQEPPVEDPRYYSDYDVQQPTRRYR